MNRSFQGILACTIALAICAGCSSGKNAGAPESTASPTAGAGLGTTASPSTSPLPSPASTSSATVKPSPSPASSSKAASTAKPSSSPSGGSGGGGKSGAVQVVAKPESITVLVNKQNSLPSNYEPADLVYPDVPFVFKEKIEKRKMRKEAAGALEKLFAGAEKDGIHLAGVSAYRSYATQKSVFQRYVAKDGEEKAKTYSAVPGTSEHETGLAIDVTGSDGKCAAEDCFGGTKEAKWLEKHAAEYGFVIRYLKGKEKITGYQYEPWHIRYVGTSIAKEVNDKDITLEEYFNAVPVSN